MVDVEKRRPTDQAKFFFSAAANAAFPGIQRRDGIDPQELANVLHKIAAGLEEMAIGLRATYIVLAEVKEATDRINSKFPKTLSEMFKEALREVQITPRRT
ncbi:MAG: hypothetical protein ABR555_07055 [Pyrinomonadaceae bacterium]